MDTNNLIGNINIVFEKLFSSIESDIFNALDEIFVIDKNLLKCEPLSKIIEIDGINYMIVIANAFIGLYSIYYIFLNFISMYNGWKTENVFKFILKLAIIVIIVSCSEYLCELLLEINNAITISIDKLAEKVINNKLNFAELKNKILSIEEYLNVPLI